jgi:nickel-dependent lactate racemase
MDVKVAYGGSHMTVSVPDGIRIDTYGARAATSPVNSETFLMSFEAAGGAVWADSKDLLVIVNDASRHTPTATVLGWLEERYPTIVTRARYLISTGAHGPPTTADFRTICGEFFESIQDRIIVHDARDLKSCDILGTDSLGGEVSVNREVTRHSHILVIGSVEPHYFAGFTGGRKSFFPGLTDLATIERNHNLANSLEARPLRLRGNPVAVHLDETMSMLGEESIFAVQVVADSNRNIAAVECGQLSDAFRRAVEKARSLYANQVDEPYDAVIAEVLPPLDSNLYQLQKGLENCQTAVRDGGTAILVSACRDGIGSRHFYEEARSWNRGTNSPVDGVLRFGSHKLSRVNGISRRVRVRLRSELDDETVRTVFFEPVVDVSDYLGALREDGKLGRLAVVRDAGHTVLGYKTFN